MEAASGALPLTTTEGRQPWKAGQEWTAEQGLDVALYEAVWGFVAEEQKLILQRDDAGYVTGVGARQTLVARTRLANRALAMNDRAWQKTGAETPRVARAVSSLRSLMERKQRTLEAYGREAVFAAIAAERAIKDSPERPHVTRDLARQAPVAAPAAPTTNGPVIEPADLDQIEMALSLTDLPRSKQYEILAEIARASEANHA